jgi:hypothetical protein
MAETETGVVGAMRALRSREAAFSDAFFVKLMPVPVNKSSGGMAVMVTMAVAEVVVCCGCDL